MFKKIIFSTLALSLFLVTGSVFACSDRLAYNFEELDNLGNPVVCEYNNQRGNGIIDAPCLGLSDNIEKGLMFKTNCLAQQNPNPVIETPVLSSEELILTAMIEAMLELVDLYTQMALLLTE